MTTQVEKDDWDASAYILRGQHCPKSVIRATLASVASALGTDQLLHIAFDNRTVVGGLCFAVGFSPESATRIETLVARADYRSVNRHLINLCREAAALSRGNSSLLPNPLVNELTRAVASLRLRHHTLSSQDRSDFTGQIISGMYLANTGHPKFSPSAGAVESVILLSGSVRSRLLLDHSNLLSKLAVQLKSTPEAAALSDQMIMEQVAERLRSQTEYGEQRPFNSFASDALDLALDVTNSQGGAVYTISGERAVSFALIASRGELPFPELLTHERPGALASVVSQNRALQLHRWPLPHAAASRVRYPEGTVLLTPIGGPGGDPRRPAIGALVLFRPAPADAFNAYDLALARNVSLRIALARTTDVMAKIGEVTTRLRTSTDWVSVIAKLERSDAKEEDSHAPLTVPLPTDIKIVANLVTPALRDLARLTVSHSATLRLALPMASVTEKHGLALVRVASYPDLPWEEGLPIITEGEGGYNWKCMRSGTAVYVPRVDPMDGYLEVRPRTASELSMPVRVEGLLVGTINLESRLFDAYSAVRPLIASFAGAVGRTLGDARASLEQRAIDDAAWALNHRHSMEGRLDDLNTAIALLRYDSSVKGILRHYTAKIEQELTAMRGVIVLQEDSDSTLAMILEEAAKEVDFLEDIPRIETDPILSTRIAGHRSKALRVAIANILSNIMNHTALSPSDAGGEPLTDIRISESFLQGENQIVLTFLNYSDSYLRSESMADLYRRPMEDVDGRLRVGAFLAGLNARRSGARLYSAVFPDCKKIRTTLVVPLESRP